MTTTTLGYRIRQARKAVGLDRKELAAKTGIAYSTLADIENDYSATCTKIATLADVLGVNALWLETEKGPVKIAKAELRPMAPDVAGAVAILEGMSVIGQAVALHEIRKLAKEYPREAVPNSPKSRLSA